MRCVDWWQDKKYLLLPWVYTLVVTVLYETGAIALLTTVHLSRDRVGVCVRERTRARVCVRVYVERERVVVVVIAYAADLDIPVR